MRLQPPDTVKQLPSSSGLNLSSFKLEGTAAFQACLTYELVLVPNTPHPVLACLEWDNMQSVEDVSGAFSGILTYTTTLDLCSPRH